MNRKRRNEELSKLCQASGGNEDESEEEESAKVIQFQNGDTSLVLSSQSQNYSFGKCDYNELLIGAHDQWHQIIVSRNHEGSR